jgi:hypothetical protein
VPQELRERFLARPFLAEQLARAQLHARLDDLLEAFADLGFDPGVARFRGEAVR